MNRIHQLIAATSIALAAGGAASQTRMQSIEVRGSTPVRTDVRALCPEVDQELHDALVRTVQQVASAATLDVRFELQGTRIGEVQVGSGPVAYQRALRRAVRGLQCNAQDPAPQVLALRVRFVDPFAQPGVAQATAVTLVSASAPTR